MNIIPIDETVSTDSQIYSIINWSDYTFEEEEISKDYKIINKFIKNEYNNLYPWKIINNQYGEIVDDLGYSFMNKNESTIPCSHGIHFYIRPDHIEYFFCKRYHHKSLRAHCCLCYKKFCKNCLEN